MSLLKARETAATAARPFKFVNSLDSTPKPDALTHRAVDATDIQSRNDQASHILTAASENDRKDKIIDELEKRLAENEENSAQALKNAIESGRKEGLKEAERQELEYLNALESSLERIRNQFEQTLAEHSALGIDIAQAAIRKVLGDKTQYPDQVEAIALHWVSKLSDAGIMQVKVSEADFVDPGKLQGLADKLRQTQIIADPELDRGSCIFDMKMGGMDASINRQLQNIDVFLNALSHDGRD